MKLSRKEHKDGSIMKINVTRNAGATKMIPAVFSLENNLSTNLNNLYLYPSLCYFIYILFFGNNKGIFQNE